MFTYAHICVLKIDLQNRFCEDLKNKKKHIKQSWFFFKKQISKNYALYWKPTLSLNKKTKKPKKTGIDNFAFCLFFKNNFLIIIPLIFRRELAENILGLKNIVFFFLTKGFDMFISLEHMHKYALVIHFQFVFF